MTRGRAPLAAPRQSPTPSGRPEPDLGDGERDHHEIPRGKASREGGGAPSLSLSAPVARGLHPFSPYSRAFAPTSRDLREAPAQGPPCLAGAVPGRKRGPHGLPEHVPESQLPDHHRHPSGPRPGHLLVSPSIVCGALLIAIVQFETAAGARDGGRTRRREPGDCSGFRYHRPKAGSRSTGVNLACACLAWR